MCVLRRVLPITVLLCTSGKLSWTKIVDQFDASYEVSSKYIPLVSLGSGVYIISLHFLNTFHRYYYRLHISTYM